MSSEYFICKDLENKIIGYFCFGLSAQIPTNEKDAYNADILDIGLGLMPDLCGRGLGAAFMQAGMDYARNIFHAKELRLTVALFNSRAIALYKKAGFSQIAKVSHRITNKEFLIMMCSL
jgi:RimJ/RimL family protein N-acetyltransferase